MSEPTITRSTNPELRGFTEYVIRIPDSWAIKQHNLRASLAALFLRLGIRVLGL